jgi:dienelactone hydrolase
MPGGIAHIEITPNPAMVDEEVSIQVYGLPPLAPALIFARTQDDAGLDWESHSMFTANAAGRINVTAQAPIGGTYSGVDAMGLFWSLAPVQPQANSNPIRTFSKNGPAPDVIRLEVELEGRVLAAADLERQFLAPGTLFREVREDGLVGRLFVPAGAGPHRVVMVLGGSAGGLDTDKAAVLASHGFATLALAYFRAENLPKWPADLPLEYFERAIGWLRQQPMLEAGRIGVLGISKGAELALLLGATLPEIAPVAAFAPSAVAWAAGARDKTTGEIHSSWSFRGQRVPFVAFRLRRFMLRSMPNYFLRRPVPFEPMFSVPLKDRGAVERAMIPVEKTNGAILLVSGDDDLMWPSTRMARMLMDRLAARGFPHPFRHLHYAGAGHALRYPYMPTTLRNTFQASLNLSVALGGNAAADAHAQTGAWRETIAFFEEHLTPA